MPRVVSVNVGMPRDHSWNGRTVHTGAWKEPVEGPRIWEAGIDPGRHDYASFAEIIDPDGHVWVIQERGHTS